ncbi:hypothetical protein YASMINEVIRUS_91 [Yasminevirus sp. GU-2018]|uniref:Uncharacterized protein n=1 Tax=Yasminevirus sp. GU-2018 TaxID=2420051 RepID=A0A5K0U6S4_9VIRU|nr:hypothetical protein YASMINEVIRUS_91 [Yasminevirus sp. GU-2018]
MTVLNKLFAIVLVFHILPFCLLLLSAYIDTIPKVSQSDVYLTVEPHGFIKSCTRVDVLSEHLTLPSTSRFNHIYSRTTLTHNFGPDFNQQLESTYYVQPVKTTKTPVKNLYSWSSSKPHTALIRSFQTRPVAQPHLSTRTIAKSHPVLGHLRNVRMERLYNHRYISHMALPNPIRNTQKKVIHPKSNSMMTLPPVNVMIMTPTFRAVPTSPIIKIISLFNNNEMSVQSLNQSFCPVPNNVVVKDFTPILSTVSPMCPVLNSTEQSVCKVREQVGHKINHTVSIQHQKSPSNSTMIHSSNFSSKCYVTNTSTSSDVVSNKTNSRTYHNHSVCQLYRNTTFEYIDMFEITPYSSCSLRSLKTVGCDFPIDRIDTIDCINATQSTGPQLTVLMTVHKSACDGSTSTVVVDVTQIILDMLSRYYLPSPSSDYLTISSQSTAVSLQLSNSTLGLGEVSRVDSLVCEFISISFFLLVTF